MTTLIEVAHSLHKENVSGEDSGEEPLEPWCDWKGIFGLGTEQNRVRASLVGSVCCMSIKCLKWRKMMSLHDQEQTDQSRRSMPVQWLRIVTGGPSVPISSPSCSFASWSSLKEVVVMVASCCPSNVGPSSWLWTQVRATFLLPFGRRFAYHGPPATRAMWLLVPGFPLDRAHIQDPTRSLQVAQEGAVSATSGKPSQLSLWKKWEDLDKNPGPAQEEFLLNRPLHILIWQSMHCWA